MKRRIRILALTLAFSMMTVQAAQAQVLISPLDVEQSGTGVSSGTQTVAVQTVPGADQTGTQTGSQVSLTGPGYADGSGMQTGTGAGLTAGTETGTGLSGEASGMTAGIGTGVGLTAGTETGSNLSGETSGMTAGTGTGTTAGTAQTGSTAVSIEAPVISAEAGILYDATHDRVLFEKNADEKLYPASITKLMTALLVLERGSLNDTVTFSETATTNLESGAVTLNLTAGDQVSVKDCLYGLLLKSANEVANGLAEYVSGSISGFADLMNEKAASLGCTNTHFVNPNGLNNPDHYTTCRDMAKIAEAAFENSTLREISSTLSYQFPATKNAAARTITPGHKMLYPTDSRYYEGIIGGKTGYTSLAGNTLVTCVERDGVRLIAVVMKAQSTHYTDTKAMLDYGYALAEAGALSGTAAQTGTGTQTAQTGWVQDGTSWRYVQADGTYAASGLLVVDGVTYGFDANGIMVTGWQKFGDDWRYFESNGAMAVNAWRQDAGKWFYLGSDGVIVKNALIDNQYYVGADGVWVQ